MRKNDKRLEEDVFGVLAKTHRMRKRPHLPGTFCIVCGAWDNTVESQRELLGSLICPHPDGARDPYARVNHEEAALMRKFRGETV